MYENIRVPPWAFIYFCSFVYVCQSSTGSGSTVNTVNESSAKILKLKAYVTIEEGLDML